MRLGIIILLLFPLSCFTQVSVSESLILMGSSFSFTAVAEDREKAEDAIKKGIEEVKRLEKLMSSWDPNSETSEINRNAGIHPVKVSEDLFGLIWRSKRISQISNGYFDISFAGMNDLWDFSGTQAHIPSKEKTEERLALVNHENIILDDQNRTVFLKNPGMKIGFGAIGKGMAANKAKEMMILSGAASGVVNAGGDLIAWGEKIDGLPWRVGIQDPENKQGILMWIPVNNQAVVTSGNYEKFIELDGKKYCHILDPKTGRPVPNLKSVTIICADAELADALSTTTFVLGVDSGMHLIDQLEGIEAVIVDDKNKVHFSKNIGSNYE